MPGILQTPHGNLGSLKLAYAFLAEFGGTFIFSLYGSATGLSAAPNTALNQAVGNGLTLAVVIYITANVSGGHINPAVTLATLITGHISLLKALLYALFQVVGGILGNLFLVALLYPTLKAGQTEYSTGCFGKTDISSGQLFGWEFILTLVLVLTVYAVAIGEPSHGVAGPLAIGLSLLVAVLAAGKFTGGAANPARALGPSVVFECHWKTTWIYILAELTGGALAGAISLPLYGKGPDFMKPFGKDNRDAHDLLRSSDLLTTELQTSE